VNARDRLSAIAARAEAATPGPWKLWAMEVLADPVGDSNLDDGLLVAHTFRPEGGPPRTFNAEFIAHARADVPALVAFATAVLDLAGRADVQLGFGCLCSGDEHDPATTYCRYGEAMAWDLDPDDILTLADEHLGGAS